MRCSIVFLFLFVSVVGHSQNMEALLKKSKAAQEKLNEEFTNPETTILSPEDYRDFKGLSFYPIDSAYIVKAKFIRTPNLAPFLMKTSTDRLPEYVKYGEAHFTLFGKQLSLNIYKNIQLSKQAKYKDFLFLPFTDMTNGEGSYGGGRYLDLLIPADDTIILDFNQAYNPYCAYSHKYSCPIPPAENHLPVKIKAGVKAFK